MQMVAVIPIFMSAGAAVLPTVAAVAASVLAIVFKPAEMLRLCRRRPWTMGGLGMGLTAAVTGLVLWIQMPAAARAANRAERPTDWAEVAQNIIVQAPLHQTNVNTPMQTPAASGAARTQDFERRNFLGGSSPVGLTPLWAYRPESTMFLSTPVLSPAADGRRVFVAGCQSDLGGYTGILACLNAQNGRPVWEINELAGEVLKPFFSSPALSADGKSLLIGQGLHDDKDCALMCFETETGKLRWSVKTPLHIESSPAIYGDMAVVGAGAIEGRDGRPTGDPGFVLAVRISDGKELWRQAVNDPESAPVIDAAGMVYIGSGFNGSAVVALRSETDEQLAGKPRIAWKTPVDQPVTGPLTLAGDLIIAGGGNSDLVHANRSARGQVVALERATGRIAWKVQTDDAVLGAMAHRDGIVLCPSRTGEILALSTKDGGIVWRARISGTAPLLAGSAFTDQRIYVLSSDGYLAALDPAGGKLIQKIFVNDRGGPKSDLCAAAPIVADGRIIVGTETGGVRGIAGAQSIGGAP